FMHIKHIPLKINGKLDKDALPSPNYLNTVRDIILPRNIREQMIYESFATILNLQHLQWSIDDDFFEYGGTSILAICLVYRLQGHLAVNIADIFKYRTVRLLAENLPLGLHSISQKLDLIKDLYRNIDPKIKQNNQQCPKYIDKYLQNAKQLIFTKFTLKPIKNVLVTGTPGFLGCHLVYELLTSTDYNVYLLVRGDSEQTASNRLEKQFRHYLGDEFELFNNYSSRLSLLCSSLDQDNLGLTTIVYENLITQIDSVIHSAALVKHYGNYKEFYTHNVQSTINLLKFTGQTQLKDFHYISTYSVLQATHNAKSDKLIYTEDCIPSVDITCDSTYVHTKLLGEHEVIISRQLGLNANIYRIGNLAYRAKNYQLPYNIEDNAFFNTLCYIKHTGKFVKELSNFEISPVDITANAIIKLFNKAELNKSTYHVFNPHKFNLTQADIRRLNIKRVSLNDFIEDLNRNLENNEFTLKFILRQGWFSSIEDIKSNLDVNILQTKTELVLKQLDFTWPEITSGEFACYAKSKLDKYFIN
ncbi:MAG: SDR family oxidoreductase, partial [Burkholderiales bacterium]|nr:SDR family oxidoreductase [Burkholderiales bacterium]